MPDRAWDLRPPAFHTRPVYEHTFGPQVARLCELVGFPPDPEQRLLLDDLFGVVEQETPNGPAMASAAFETAVIATRQNLKSGLAKQAALGWMFVTQEETITWSAHLFSTTQEAFRDMASMVDNTPMLRKRMAGGPSHGIHGGAQNVHMETRDGRRLMFKSRTKTGGRGLTGDKMILDEAFALTEEHLGALTPTLTAVPDPQILYASSAGLVGSDVLREIRDRGRVGSPGLAYAEWCARLQKCRTEDCQHWKPSHPLHRPGCALDDEALWAEANPLLGRQRINGTGLTLPKMRKFREAEPPAEWMRERLGWWDEAGADELFGLGNWEATLGQQPAGLPVEALAVAASYDLRWAAVAAASLAGERTVVRPLAHGPGIDWVVEHLRTLQGRFPVPVEIDQRGPAAVLLDPLEGAGVRVHEVDTGEALDAFAHLQTLVAEGLLLREDFPILDQAVGAAKTRSVGDRTALGRRSSTADISTLEAVMLAARATRREQIPAPPVPPPPMLAPRRTPANSALTMSF